MYLRSLEYQETECSYILVIRYDNDDYRYAFDDFDWKIYKISSFYLYESVVNIRHDGSGFETRWEWIWILIGREYYYMDQLGK